MGCVCCSLSTFVSIVLHALERISLCTVCAMLVCCLLITVMTVLIIGVGIGFHYCEVQNAVEAMAKAANQAADIPKDEKSERGGNQKGLRSVGQAVKRGFAHQLGRRDISGQLMPSNNNTINDMLLGRSVNPAPRRYKRDLTEHLNDTVIQDYTTKLNDSIIEDYTSKLNNSIIEDFTTKLNDSIIEDYTSKLNNSIIEDFTTKLNNSIIEDYTSKLNNLIIEDFTTKLNDSIIEDYTPKLNNSIIEDYALNDTINDISYVYDSLNVINDSYADEMKQNCTNKTLAGNISGSLAYSNVSIPDAMLLRQNCTLLNFFTRFFQF